MINKINTFNNFYNYKLAQTNNTISNNGDLTVNKSDLSRVLFGERASVGQNISFGWSKGLPEVEEKILNILTNAKNKNVLVVSHTTPDPDAYASNVGVCGILERMGVKTYPVVDDLPLRGYKNMPSIQPGKTAAEFIKTSLDVKKAWNKASIDSVDVAVLTDCAEPNRITKNVFKLISKAKKVIIIDHHGSKDSDLSNKEKWFTALKEANPNLDNTDILYWRETKRQSASEMVAELDKEIKDEYKTAKDKKSGWFLKYDPQYYGGYRTALAAGIYADSGGMTQQGSNAPGFKHKSEKQIKTPQGNVNSNDFYYKWLSSNSGTRISVSDITKSQIPRYIFNTAREIITGERKIDGINVVNATKESPFGYAHIQQNANLGQLINPLDINKDDVTTEDIHQAIKVYSKPDIQGNECKLFVLAKSNANCFTLSMRSKESVAAKVLDILTANGFGEGGGHNDACGFKSKAGKSIEEVLPLINKVIEDHTEEERKLQEKILTETNFINKTFLDVANGVQNLEGLTIKPATSNNYVGYVHIKDLSALDNILNTSKVRDKEAFQQYILERVENLSDTNILSENCQCFIVVKNNKENNTITMDVKAINLVSSKVFSKLNEAGFGVHEGKQFSFFENKDFESALPIIEETVNNFFEDRRIKQEAIAKENAIIDTTLRNLIEGVQKIEGIETLQITDKNPIGYVYVKDFAAIGKILNQPSVRNETALQNDIFKRLEEIADEYSSDPTKLLITAKRIAEVPRFAIKFSDVNPLSNKLAGKISQIIFGTYDIKNDRFKSDSGREFEEAIPIIKEFARENCLTIQPSQVKKEPNTRLNIAA